MDTQTFQLIKQVGKDILVTVEWERESKRENRRVWKQAREL